MSQQESVSIGTLKAIADAFNAHDLDAIMEFFEDDCSLDMPQGPEPWGQRFTGKASVREGLATRFKGLPDVHYSDDRHWVSGNLGVSEWLLNGTTPDGVRVQVRGCDHWEFRDGKVIRKDSYWKIVEKRQTPELTRGRWWKGPLTFVGLLLTTVGALGCLTLITATTDDQAQRVILSIPAQRAWLIAILGGAVGGLARALYQYLVDNYAFHYLRIAKRSSLWAMKSYGLKDDKDMEDDYDPLESWHLFFVKPLVGATLGLLFALAVDLGLLGLGNIEGDKRFMRLVVTAGLAGLFAENVLQRLEGLLKKP